jgi:hypothetical protein
MKDLCISCGKESLFNIEDHIDMRYGYIEGAGQLCHACWIRGTDRKQFLVPHNIVYNTPNDQELGAKVRELYYESYP